MKHLKIGIISFIIVLFFSGYGTFDMQRSAELTRPVFFQELSFKHSIYIAPMNQSMTMAQLHFLIRQKLVSYGYTIESDPAKAHFTLQVEPMQVNSNEEQNAPKGAIEGAIAGGLIGALVGHGSNRGESAAIGAGIGLGTGALLGYGLQDGQMTMQMAVMIVEKVQGKRVAHQTSVIAKIKEDHLSPREGLPILERMIAGKIASIFAQE